MAAPCSLARSRKRGKRPLPTSPAPSQEKITNWGGGWPGSNGSALAGWWGWLPVNDVEPSPMGRAGCDVRPDPPTPEPDAWLEPSDDLRAPQAESEAAAAAPAPRPSIPLRESVHIPSPIRHVLWWS